MNINVIYSDQFKKGEVSIAVNSPTTWEDIAGNIMDIEKWDVINDESEKSTLAMWSLAEVKLSGGRRTNDNIKSRSGLLLDYDYDASKESSIFMTFEDIQEDLKEFEYVLYSSVSYGRKEGFRCRIVVPFENSISPELFQELYASFQARFPYIDRSCFVLSQGQNVPVHYAEVTPYVHYNNGKFMNPTRDIEFVENVKTNTFDVSLFKKCEIEDDELNRVFDAVVSHCQHSLDYQKAWFFAQVMKNYGVYDYWRVSQVQTIGSNTTPQQHYANSNANYDFNIYKLKNYVPKDFVFPKSITEVEPVIVKKEDIVQIQATSTKDFEYDKEFFLNSNQYLSDVAEQIDWTIGNTILIGDCGIGKTHYWSGLQAAGHKVAVITPLRLIVEQNTTNFEDENDITKSIATYNQIKNFPAEEAKDYILVIDEAHGLYLDDFKGDLNRLVQEKFKEFKAVVLMSGTIRPEYFCNVEFDQVVRIHKVQAFRKVIQQVRSEDITIDLFMMAQRKIVERGFKNKVLIFNNNIKENEVMINNIHKKFGHNIELLPVSARPEHKNSEKYKQFKETQMLGKLNGLIGTNSLVEGINIIDELEECDVHIIGDLSPERIEQVTNRFRKCTGTINIFHYVHNMVQATSIEEIQDTLMGNFDSVEIMEASTRLRDAFNYLYGLMGKKQQYMRLNTYGRELKCANLYWNETQFEVCYSAIDSLMSEQRLVRSVVSYDYYRNILASYGFLFRTPLNTIAIENLFDDKAEVKKAHEERRVQAIINLKNNYNPETNSWDVSDEDGETAIQRGYVERLIKKGLKYSDVHEYLNRLEKNENYWMRLANDLRDSTIGNLTSKMIQEELHRYTIERKGVVYLTPTDRDELALKVARHTLQTHFNSNVSEMKSNDVWKNKIDVVDGEIVLGSQSQAARDIIDSYIWVGASKKITVNGTSVRCNEIVSTTRTGFTFGNIMKATGASSVSIEQIKAKIAAIRN